MNAPTNLTTVSIDTLGTLLAEIDKLTIQAEMIKDQLKDACSLTEINESGNQRLDVLGSLFKACVTGGQVSTTDTKKLYADFGITEEVLAKYKKAPSARFTVKVTSR
jgi:hypothetical protein